MRLLLTNDDGVHSPGIHAMAVALRDAGREVVIVAPSDERSGWGAGVGSLFHGAEVDVTTHRVPDADDIETWAVDGPPALCVLIAMLEVLGPRPDLVVSGINVGKTVSNVNVPNRTPDELEGVRWARLAAFGSTSTKLEGSVPGPLTVHLLPRYVALKPDTDTALVDAGYVTVTGLVGIRAESDDSGTAAGDIEAALQTTPEGHP